MPNRWIKEAYLASSRLNAASPEARDCWVRLLVVADDHGLFHANPQLVASRCYPLAPNARKCAQLLDELEAVRLISRYQANGRPYLRIEQWYERARAGPKYPLPPTDASNCEQVQADASNGEQMKAPTSTPYIHDHDHDHDHGYSARAREAEAGNGPKRTAAVRLEAPDAKHRELAAELGVDVEREFAAYRDHFAANGRRHKDEAAGFRNWLRNAERYGAGRKAGRSREPTLAERRVATLDAICGRTRGNGQDIAGVAERVDRAPVHPLPVDLRQPDGDDVGGREPGGPVANVG